VKVYRPPQKVLAEVERVLASSRPRFGGETPLDQVVEILYHARHYFWIGIYLVVGNQVVRQTFRGPVPPCHTFEFGKGNVGTTGQTGILKVIPDVSDDPTYSMCFIETKSEIVVPIKISSRVLGVIDVESDKVNAFGYGERVLLKHVAQRLARFLSVRGRYLVRGAAEKSEAKRKAGVPKSAAAGDGQHR
jgi:putative methionine-R-sulfoxide reductase with GAF domain